MWIPHILGKIRARFVDIDKIHKFSVDVWVVEGFVAHENVIKVGTLLLESKKFGHFCLALR